MINYDFHDLSKRTDRELEQQITEGFTFGDFNSTENGMFLVSRDAPTPDSKDIVDSVPYMQGVYDYSVLNFDRYFENREITYQVILFEKQYVDRKIPEQEIKRQLMPYGVQTLYDTHDEGYHWLGKCKSVSVEDDSEKNVLIATVVFDCYPFAILDDTEGADIWDDVYFPRWVFQDTKFTVNNILRVELYNIGSTSVIPDIIASSDFKSEGQTNEITVKQGENTDTQLALDVGQNILFIRGNGTIEFRFHREEMI